MNQKLLPTGGPATHAAWTLTGFQVNLYAEDVEAAIAFYTALGFEEIYRDAAAGTALHVEVRNSGLTIGVSSIDAARSEHGFAASQEGASVEIVLWCNDSDAAYTQALAALGDKVLQRTAWKVADQLGWETTYDAEFVALTQLQADCLVTSDGDLARAVSGLVETATIDTLHTA
jgi:catechol 2,3-dioxygenase-like lactoylglutathione lyase family enzyme